MAHAYNGPDPAQVVDSDTYELGTAAKANVDLTITGVRVWSGAGPVDLTPRTATIWSNAGAALSVKTLPGTLSAGWVEFTLDTPVTRTTGQGWVASFGSGGNYGFLSHGLDSDLVSDDGAVTTLGFANAPTGINGRFNVTPGDFPAQGNASHGFYGVDTVYTIGIGGNTAPSVTALALARVGATVTALATVTDAETLVGATLRYNWGDGTADSVSSWPDVTEAHTYALSGIYAVMVSVTDADGLAGYRAAAIEVTVPADVVDGVDVSSILDHIMSHAGRLGDFERLQTHEPKTAATQGMTAAGWVSEIGPVPEMSGLSQSAIRIAFIFRLYDNMMREPADLIDPEMTALVNRLFLAYHADFTLGGVCTQIDLLGAHGAPLAMQSGYIPQDGKMMRAMSVYIPVIVAEGWNQEA